MLKKYISENRFMGSLDDFEASNIVIIGAPMDFTSSFKSGSRFGPQKIRDVSDGIEEFSFYTQKSLLDKKYYDAGDLELPFGNVTKSLEIIYNTASSIIKNHKFSIFVGGEHLISLPVIKTYYEKYKDELVIIQLDAHADLRLDYIGETYSHATVIRKVTEFVSPKNIYQLGIRSGTKDELEFAKNNTNIYTFDFISSLESICTSIGNRPVYITLDIDVADPAYANGTGTPEPGGCTSNDLIWSIIKLMTLNVVGFDLVEVSPEYDNSDRTALLASKIIREVILNKK